jgi:hypothetical protein
MQLAQSSDDENRRAIEELIDETQEQIDDILDDEDDRRAYEEMTGTTAEDLYLERNSHAIRQGELIEQFRNER